jgi:hypothetical protein
VQIGDVLVSGNNLFRVVESEFSEDTDFMQKVLDFTSAVPVEEQEQPGQKREAIARIKTSISENYFKCYEKRIVNETFSYNQYPGYLVHAAFLKQVKVVDDLASDPIPKNIKRYQGIERFSKQSDFQF